MGKKGRGLVDELRALPGFGALPAAEVRVLADAGRVTEHPDGATILEQDTHGDDMHVILSGAAEVRRDGDPVQALGPGDVFGEFALLLGTGRTASVVATGNLRTLAFAFGSIRELLERTPEFATTVHGTMLLRAHENRLAEAQDPWDGPDSS